jgi:hypothetical protein
VVTSCLLCGAVRQSVVITKATELRETLFDLLLLLWHRGTDALWPQARQNVAGGVAVEELLGCYVLLRRVLGGTYTYRFRCSEFGLSPDVL